MKKQFITILLCLLAGNLFSQDSFVENSITYCETSPSTEGIEQIQKKDFSNDHNRFRISANGGFCGNFMNRPRSEYSPEYASFLSQQDYGFILSCDATYLFKDWGFGIKYDRFHPKNISSNRFYAQLPNGGIIHGTISYDNIMSFYGAYVLYRIKSHNGRHILTPDFSIGYLNDHNDIMEFEEKYVMIVKTIESSIGLGYEFLLSRHFSIGLRTACLYSRYKDYDVIQNGITEHYDSDPENRFRINFLGGLHFYF